MMIKWPGVIEPGRKSNQIISHLDWFPTFMSALGDDDMKERMLTEAPFGEGNEPVHLDGYDFMPYFRGEVRRRARAANSSTSPTAAILLNLRYNRWKVVFAEQRAAWALTSGRSR